MRVYGVRPNEKGWKTATDHPYSYREGTAEEKQVFSVSGTHGMERVRNQAAAAHAPERRDGGLRTSPEVRDSRRPAGAGQARNPLQR